MLCATVNAVIVFTSRRLRTMSSSEARTQMIHAQRNVPDARRRRPNAASSVRLRSVIDGATGYTTFDATVSVFDAHQYIRGVRRQAVDRDRLAGEAGSADDLARGNPGEPHTLREWVGNLTAGCREDRDDRHSGRTHRRHFPYDVVASGQAFAKREECGLQLVRAARQGRCSYPPRI
jgi:hypothetical protein